MTNLERSEQQFNEPHTTEQLTIVPDLDQNLRHVQLGNLVTQEIASESDVRFRAKQSLDRLEVGRTKSHKELLDRSIDRIQDRIIERVSGSPQSNPERARLASMGEFEHRKRPRY